MTCLYSIAVTFCFLVIGTVSGFSVREERLRQDLLANYDKHSLPDESTTVKFRITIKHFQMMEQSHTLMVDTWMVNEWMDPRLRWDPEDYSSISKLTVPHESLWKPDIDVYNRAEFGKSLTYDNTLLLVSSDGRVIFVPPVQLHFTCVMDLTYWPHDTHNCTCIFGSWVHDGFAIDLQAMDDKPELDMPTRLTDEGLNLTRGEWELKDVSIVRDIKYYNCCVEPYITIHMSMLMSRNAPAYDWIVKGPALGLSILTLVLFMLPPAAGEKMTFGLLCLLLDMIFIAYTSFIIHLSPSHTPLIVKLVCKQVMLVIGSIVVGAFSLRMARDPHSSGLPLFIKRPLIIFSTCLCLQTYKNLVSRVHHQSYSRSLKSDEFELKENGNGHVYTGEVTTSPGLDWLLLAAVIDRVCLVAFIAIFIVNMITYNCVL